MFLFRIKIEAFIFVSIGFILVGCDISVSSEQGEGFDDGSNSEFTTSFNESALITHITNNIITPTLNDFDDSLLILNNMMNDYCLQETAFNNGEVSEDIRNTAREAARSEWKAAMLEWQKIEVLLLGPLLENNSALRNKIYSWPQVSTCGVDQDIVFFDNGQINGAPYNITNRTNNRRGLDALEYLLFNDNLDHTCSDNISVLLGWENLTEAQRRELRCAFAREVSSDLMNSSDELLTAWNGNDGFAQSLIGAGDTESLFNTPHDAVNEITDALFYIDSVTKDAKLARPLGLVSNSCNQLVCPEDRESLFANHSLENVQANLQSLRMIFTGEKMGVTETLGFDDFLIEEGYSETANSIIVAIDTALNDIDAYNESLASALNNNVSQVETTHTNVKAITDQLKEDFITQLSLTLPSTSAGDSD